MTGDVPSSIVFNLGGGIFGLDGLVACPECGESKLLTVTVRTDAVGDGPTPLQCPWGHAWVEAALPYSWFTGSVQQLIDEHPGLWQAMLDEANAQGGIAFRHVHNDGAAGPPPG
ncbi:hypothetical protein ACNF49_38330 [Actinomadura sp. ATCC 39365]